MQVYEKSADPAYFCGHWNGSPVEIGDGKHVSIPEGEVLHHHPYYEYYVVLEGQAELEVDGKVVKMEAGQVIMVEPGENHKVISISPEGARWIIVKERSEPDSKVIPGVDAV